MFDRIPTAAIVLAIGLALIGGELLLFSNSALDADRISTLQVEGAPVEPQAPAREDVQPMSDDFEYEDFEESGFGDRSFNSEAAGPARSGQTDGNSGMITYEDYEPEFGRPMVDTTPLVSTTPVYDAPLSADPIPFED